MWPLEKNTAVSCIWIYVSLHAYANAYIYLFLYDGIFMYNISGSARERVQA